MARRENSDYLFVYGTLRRPGSDAAHRALRRHATIVGTAYLRGSLFDLGPYPGAVPGAAERSHVKGDLYRMQDRRALLPELDAYEGCGSQEPAPSEFKREIVSVAWDKENVVRAWADLYTRPPKGLARIESGDYLDFIKQRKG